MLAIGEENLQQFKQICARERCPYAIVGKALDRSHLLVNDKLLKSKPVNLPMSVLFGQPPRMHRDVTTRESVRQALEVDIELDEVVNRGLGHPTVAAAPDSPQGLAFRHAGLSPRDCGCQKQWHPRMSRP